MSEQNELKLLQQKYPDEWNACAGDDKLFLKLVRAKERMQKLEAKLRQKAEIERSREARALIILSKLLIREQPSFIHNFVKRYTNEFLQKERGKQLDYSAYILRLLKERQGEGDI